MMLPGVSYSNSSIEIILHTEFVHLAQFSSLIVILSVVYPLPYQVWSELHYHREETSPSVYLSPLPWPLCAPVIGPSCTLLSVPPCLRTLLDVQLKFKTCNTKCVCMSGVFYSAWCFSGTTCWSVISCLWWPIMCWLSRCTKIGLFFHQLMILGCFYFGLL